MRSTAASSRAPTARPARLASTLAGLATLAAVVATPARAFALRDGMVGFSGVRADGSSPICNKCHAGGVAPAVRFEGPETVQPGATETFRFMVESQSADQKAAGLDVAATGGALEPVDGEGEQVVEGEITHVAPKPNADGVATWAFTWTAPLAPGRYGLFGAGNSVNVDGLAGGDGAARAMLEVLVPGETFTPAPTPTATPTPSVTPTPSPSPTPSPPPCAGDCDGDGQVGVDELIRGIQVGLGAVPVERCDALDENRDRLVSIAELSQAVERSLRGCR